MLDIYYCYSAYYNKAGNTLEIFLLNILLVQKIRLIFAFIKRTFKKHLIISNISFYIPTSYPHKCIIEVT